MNSLVCQQIVLNLNMKVTSGNLKTKRALIPHYQSKDKVTNQNTNFSNGFLKNQVFYKPNSQRNEQTTQLNYRESEKETSRKSQSNAMSNSFISSYSGNQIIKKQQENLKKMIVNLSHQLQVKDSIITSLHNQIISIKDGVALQSNNSPRDLSQNRNSYFRFKAPNQINAVTLQNLSRQNSREKMRKETLSNTQFVNLDKKTIFKSKFLQCSKEMQVDQTEQGHIQLESKTTELSLSKLNHKISELQQSLKAKQRQLKVVLSQKKLLSLKLIDTQKCIFNLEGQLKILKNNNQKNNIFAEDSSKQFDAKHVYQYEQELTKHKKQIIALINQIDELKKSKSQQIDSSVREWKKINQAMTDSLMKLNQQNSSLTKKLTDLELRSSTTSAKISELERQNATLKFNLQTQKNSYSALAAFHKHQKDDYTKKINHLDKQLTKVRIKYDSSSMDLQKLQLVNCRKQQQLCLLRSQLSLAREQNKSQLLKCREDFLKQKEQYEKSSLTSHLKQLQFLDTSLKQKQQQLVQQRESKKQIQNQLDEALKVFGQSKGMQQLNIQRCQQSRQSKTQVENVNTNQNQGDNIQRVIHENLLLKRKINILCKNLEKTQEQGKDVDKSPKLYLQKQKQIDQIKMKFQEKVRLMSQQIIFLRNNKNPNSQIYKEIEGIQVNLDSTQINNGSSFTLKNQELQNEIQHRDQVIHQLQLNIRHQQNTIIGLKLHLDETNRRSLVQSQILECCNKHLIQSELRYQNHVYQSEQSIVKLREDNSGLQDELKIIYQKLQYFERRLEQNEQQQNEQEFQEENSNFYKQKFREQYKEELIQSD